MKKFFYLLNCLKRNFIALLKTNLNFSSFLLDLRVPLNSSSCVIKYLFFNNSYINYLLSGLKYFIFSASIKLLSRNSISILSTASSSSEDSLSLQSGLSFSNESSLIWLLFELSVCYERFLIKTVSSKIIYYIIMSVTNVRNKLEKCNKHDYI